MDISIVICSYNRAHNLPECFDCLLAQEGIDGLRWEVILVDNNSTDDTKAVALGYAGSGDGKLDLKYCFEGKQGLSHARNKGIQQSTGDIVVFIDDDIRVAKSWLKTISETFKAHDCDAMGGRIHVQRPAQLPKWITPDMYGFLGHQDFGVEPHAMDGKKEFPFGGNMAMRRRVFQLIGVFDTNLGRRGEGRQKEELFKGEETDFFHRLAETGGSFRYHPDMLVMHKILPYQLEKKFFLTLHSNAGALDARRDPKAHARRFLGVPLFVYPQLLRAWRRYILSLLTKGPSLSFRNRMNVSYFVGMMLAYRNSLADKNDGTVS